MRYAFWCPYQIIRTTDHGSYFMRKLHRPDSPKLKLIAHDLYPLLPFLKPCEPVDTTYTQYLNQLYGPLINPLKRVLYIELYNDRWLDKPLTYLGSNFTYKHDTLKL